MSSVFFYSVRRISLGRNVIREEREGMSLCWGLGNYREGISASTHDMLGVFLVVELRDISAEEMGETLADDLEQEMK